MESQAPATGPARREEIIPGMKPFVHEELEKEVRSISGSYTFVEENRLRYKERDVLYCVGVALLDNSCCGVGGCRFINVPGYVIAWKQPYKNSAVPVSTVEPITDEEEKREIKRLLDHEYPHSQIHFDTP